MRNMMRSWSVAQPPSWSSRIARSAVLCGNLTVFLSNLGIAAALTDIHAAIRAGDVEAVQTAIQDRTELNRADSWGRTPLIVALQQGKATIVEMLIDRGADVSATDAWGRTPLLVATQLKNTAAIRLLLERHPDPNAANKNDITPLIAAAQTGNREAVAQLLAAGAAPDRADNLGWTALMWAAYRKDHALVAALLDKGADAALAGRDKSTALDIARKRGADAALVTLLTTSASSGTSAGPDAAGAGPARPKSATAAAAAISPAPAADPGRIVRGNPKAAITIFEYTDFQCPYCRQGARTVEEVMARYEGQVRLIVKHMPLPLLHPMAMTCALYFEAIAMQDASRAWAFYDRLFADQGALGGGEPHLQKVAAELGTDMQRLEQALKGTTAQGRIAADLEESQRYKFDGVPAFVISGHAIEGAQPAETFFEVIDAALQQ